MNFTVCTCVTIVIAVIHWSLFMRTSGNNSVDEIIECKCNLHQNEACIDIKELMSYAVNSLYSDES